MPPRLSVVVPFYNVGEYLEPCLDSIARQTWTDFEAILVDDGSLDGTWAIAERLVVSVRTVDNHLQRANAKLGIGGRHELDGALR